MCTKKRIYKACIIPTYISILIFLLALLKINCKNNALYYSSHPSGQILSISTIIISKIFAIAVAQHVVLLYIKC